MYTKKCHSKIEHFELLPIKIKLKKKKNSWDNKTSKPNKNLMSNNLTQFNNFSNYHIPMFKSLFFEAEATKIP